MVTILNDLSLTNRKKKKQRSLVTLYISTLEFLSVHKLFYNLKNLRLSKCCHKEEKQIFGVVFYGVQSLVLSTRRQSPCPWRVKR